MFELPANRAAATMWSGDRASQSLGMEITSVEPGRAVVTMPIRNDMLNGLDVCHGGLVFSLADTAMAFASNAHDDIAFAVTADMTWLRPAVEGDLLTASVTQEVRAGRTGVYDVTVVNQDGETVALFRGRVRHTGRPLTE
jgi:acyl-CoA thioesterase